MKGGLIIVIDSNNINDVIPSILELKDSSNEYRENS
jgi:hypothetical protein